MTNIEAYLIAGEEVLWRGNPQVSRSQLTREAVVSFIRKVAAIAVVSAGAFSVLYVRKFVEEESIADYLLWTCAFILAVIVLALIFAIVTMSSPRYHLLEQRYVLTDRRLLIFEGEFRKLVLFPGAISEVDVYCRAHGDDVSILVYKSEVDQEEEAHFHQLSRIKDSSALLKLITERFGARFSGEYK